MRNNNNCDTRGDLHMKQNPVEKFNDTSNDKTIGITTSNSNYQQQQVTTTVVTCRQKRM